VVTASATTAQRARAAREGARRDARSDATFAHQASDVSADISGWRGARASSHE
jgi:hypothetical protein